MEDNQILDRPKIYQALGIISGILELSEENYSSILVGEQIYFATISPKVRAKHQPGQLQNFKIYPAIRKGELGFSLRVVTQKVPREAGILLRGCWEIYEEEPRLVIHRNLRTRRATPTALPLIWKEAPATDGQYWEIEAKLKGEKFEVVQAIRPFEPPQKYQKRGKSDFSNAKSDLPRPILKSIEPKEIKSELQPPALKSAKTSIAALAPMAIKPSESQPIAESTVSTKAVEVIEAIASSEITAIASAPKELTELEETEASPVVVEAVTPKAKKAGSKSSASKKSLIALGTDEPKKTKEKVKSSRSKKSMSLAADRLFLGKQLPPGK